MKKLILIIAIFLTACTITNGNKSTKKLYKEEGLVGKNFQEISAKYQNYQQTWRNQKGDNIYSFSYNYSYPDFLCYLPLIQFFGNSIAKDYEVVIEVDDKNKITKVQKFYDEKKMMNYW